MCNKFNGKEKSISHRGYFVAAIKKFFPKFIGFPAKNIIIYNKYCYELKVIEVNILDLLPCHGPIIHLFKIPAQQPKYQLASKACRILPNANP